ncbi:hypothetical protein B0H10DRAFT_1959595 [Mycena sp. CBHHK59/15]|nr:hypothetical protein B0H10DRAFT_1959595 [Mycena sp. CBHHK59/15]
MPIPPIVPLKSVSPAPHPIACAVPRRSPCVVATALSVGVAGDATAGRAQIGRTQSREGSAEVIELEDAATTHAPLVRPWQQHSLGDSSSVALMAMLEVGSVLVRTQGPCRASLQGSPVHAALNMVMLDAASVQPTPGRLSAAITHSWGTQDASHPSGARTCPQDGALGASHVCGS